MYIQHWQFPEGEENKWYAVVYLMEYNSRSCRYDTSYVHLIMLNGKGFNKSTECREFLREQHIYAYSNYNVRKKIVVKKLSDLRPILEGKTELSYGPSGISFRLGEVKNYQTKTIISL